MNEDFEKVKKAPKSNALGLIKDKVVFALIVRAYALRGAMLISNVRLPASENSKAQKKR
jgi:hypothetical protein